MPLTSASAEARLGLNLPVHQRLFQEIAAKQRESSQALATSGVHATVRCKARLELNPPAHRRLFQEAATKQRDSSQVLATGEMCTR
ncbi:hypothetical protein HPB52_018786 [Rhipicephalus sanguineus]|uniref:Uncharacterized protein n=1 Tax=Rhipicephalus sanguineus TaxID=34632 RepID=A0A9D4PKF3_RHISA|nr:hypothetical protein HPB52_018786 [Rhipicephalus sanguineus]